MFKHRSNLYDIILSSNVILTLTHSHPILTTNGWRAINVEAAKKEHWIDDL